MDYQIAKALVQASEQVYDDSDSNEVVAHFTGRITRCIVKKYNDTHIISFRGTRPDHIQDWEKDLEAELVPFPYGPGKVHEGFLTALQEVYEDLKSFMENHKESPVYITGHSLGGAIAVLLAASNLFPDLVLYTFGQPRVGDDEFVASLEKLNYTRIVNNNDIVPDIPSWLPHGGQLMWYKDHYAWWYLEDKLEDHEIKEYWTLIHKASLDAQE